MVCYNSNQSCSQRNFKKFKRSRLFVRVILHVRQAVQRINSQTQDFFQSFDIINDLLTCFVVTTASRGRVGFDDNVTR